MDLYRIRIKNRLTSHPYLNQISMLGPHETVYKENGVNKALVKASMIGKKGEGKMIKHVVAFDVNMGKSTMVVYNRYRQYKFEGEILHNRPSFEQLHETLEQLTRWAGT